MRLGCQFFFETMQSMMVYFLRLSYFCDGLPVMHSASVWIPRAQTAWSFRNGTKFVSDVLKASVFLSDSNLPNRVNRLDC